MTPKQLNYFTRIAELGSFSAASKQLHIAQSALSLQMTKFEAELGVSLFFRKPRGVELTEAGERLSQHAYSIQRHIETALLDIQSEDLEPEGVIKVGMVPTINNVMAARLYRTIQNLYPKLRLDIVGGPSIYLNRQLENRRLDISLGHADSNGFGELKVTPIFKENLFFVGSSGKKYKHIRSASVSNSNGKKENVIRFADIANYQTLSTEAQDGLGFRIAQYERDQDVELNKRPSLGQLTSDLNEIINGQAEMILPWSAIHHLAGSKTLTTARIIEPVLERDIFLLTNPKSRMTNSLIKTESQIRKIIPDLFDDGLCVGRLIQQP